MHKHTIGLIGGTGIEGRGIAIRLAATGCQVGLGSRSSDRARQVARELNEQLGQSSIDGVDNATLVAEAELLFITVPFIHVDALLLEHSNKFTSSQVVVDVTVPLLFDKGPRLLDLPEGSGAEHLAKQLPSHVPLVAAFKTMPAQMLADVGSAINCDEFVCSDNAEAKKRALEVLGKIEGIRWIDAGPLRNCRTLERMTLLAIDINRRYKIKTARFQVVGL